ncbi:MAG: homocysteine S-methyltransferase family protein [Eubacteriales bacterium]|nr:homocysteine S-methyltransferase family protein [Eubacteriales bacterium]
MDKEKFMRLIKNKTLILDGASGTEMQKKGMPNGVCPEIWVSENPRLLIDTQKKYFGSGSEAVYTFTLGANRLKLSHYRNEIDVSDLNKKLAHISRTASGKSGLVAGDISTTGHFIAPFGDLPFEEAVGIYKEQVKGLLEGGVDFFVIETMIDIREARAALLAVKESCSLPVCVSMTFSDNGKTLTGTDPMTAVITLQSLGADVVGCNCSTGPRQMIRIIEEMKSVAKVPLIAKPNAGIPELKNGKTTYSIGPEEFGTLMRPFAELGVNLIGGCCGTTPEHIEAIKKHLPDYRKPEEKPVFCGAVTSATRTVFINPSGPLAIIGERINPTGKKKLTKELLSGKMAEVGNLAIEQAEAGADILDVNVGVPGIDEKSAMREVVEELAETVDTPLCIDSSDPEAIESALRIYPGRALINSVSAEKSKMEKLFPIAAKYGAMIILLPIDENGIPQYAEQRCSLIREAVKKAGEYGISKEDILADGLAMAVSAEENAPEETLKVIEWCREKFKIASVIGLSNISFGLPERQHINAAFLSMAADRGLTAAIANPEITSLMDTRFACDVLTGRDLSGLAYIRRFTAKRDFKATEEDKGPEADSRGKNRNSETAADLFSAKESIEKGIYDAVIEGNPDAVVNFTEKALKTGVNPQDIVDRLLIPAINKVGDLFDKQIYYLPQLIRSANTMKAAFEKLQPLLEKESSGKAGEKIKVVLATVKGDIHDIGKNIVALMMRNHGFEIYDLGKDVSAEEIVGKAAETGAKIVSLSALMTTTIGEMKNVIKLIREKGLDCKVMIGGAVVTGEYAGEIGADGYAPDANAAVKVAVRLAAEI